MGPDTLKTKAICAFAISPTYQKRSAARKILSPLRMTVSPLRRWS